MPPRSASSITACCSSTNRPSPSTITRRTSLLRTLSAIPPSTLWRRRAPSSRTAASPSRFWAVSRPYSVPARVWTSPHGLPSVTARPPRTPPSVWPNRRKRAMWKRATRTNPSATTSPRSRRRTTPCRRTPSSPMRIWFSASAPNSSISPMKPPSRARSTAPCPPVWSPPSRSM